jgi:hypothetical protein
MYRQIWMVDDVVLRGKVMEWPVVGTYQVESIVKNYGSSTESDFNVNATIFKVTGEGDDVFYQDNVMVTTTMFPGDNVTITFDNVTFHEGDGGIYRLEVTTELVDDDPNNNRKIMIFGITSGEATTHNFFGTMGENGWYVSDVTVEIIKPSWAKFTYYSIGDGSWQEYEEPFEVCEDAVHNLRYYSVDYYGNGEDMNSTELYIDQTPPTIDLTWEDDSKLVADVYDETSDVAKVEFYVNGVYDGKVTTSPYEWEVTRPKKGDKGRAIVYDKAGNDATSEEIDAVSQGNSQSQSSSSVPFYEDHNLFSHIFFIEGMIK